jgi:surface polysaccharide O-acyltransferase-like enzyme
MFKLVFKKFRTATLFEKLLLIVGISISIVGFWFINQVYYSNPALSWSFLMVTFLWLILIFLVILTDSNESIKEELSYIIREHIEETKLLKEEVKVLNQRLTKKYRK